MHEANYPAIVSYVDWTSGYGYFHPAGIDA